MSDILNKTIVLVLNRNWQAINIRTPQDAFCQMATNVATALHIVFDNEASHLTPDTSHLAHASAIRPVTWDEWITLPVRDGDNAVRTTRGAIRVPNRHRGRELRTRAKEASEALRDGNRCQYTGKLLKPDEGSLDHVLPRSRGKRTLGKTLCGRART